MPDRQTRRLFAAAALLVGVIGLVIDGWVIFPSMMSVSPGNPVARSLPDVTVYYWTYFTHLTNLGLVLVYMSELTGWSWLGWFRRPQTQTLMAGFITLVMLFYHFMLSPYLQMEGALLLATVLLHYVTPIAYLVWWAAFMPHGSLQWRDLPWMLVPGIVYVAWVLLRGLWAHEYPYDILNPEKLGYGGVAIGVGIIFLAVSMFCVVLIWLDGALARRRTR
ncbi:MAG: Pr6Pr family membrane protein [Alphaproteobacteria bacterium]|nr:Pr6Pr family membrane protein [Alphaproteobacteria bacterium]